jgi:hypothetical protein
VALATTTFGRRMQELTATRKDLEGRLAALEAPQPALTLG